MRVVLWPLNTQQLSVAIVQNILRFYNTSFVTYTRKRNYFSKLLRRSKSLYSSFFVFVNKRMHTYLNILYIKNENAERLLFTTAESRETNIPLNCLIASCQNACSGNIHNSSSQ